MLSDLADEASQVGLEIHMGKTKILSASAPDGGDKIQIGSVQIEILPPDKSITYLGRSVCMDSFNESELDHRIAKAWGKFAMYKKELCCKHYSLQQRLKLFDTVVTPSLLYGSGCWVMHSESAHKLKVAQRRMLRMMVDTRRRRN
eukprot:9211251-Karenia_brevis.AAC.1